MAQRRTRRTFSDTTQQVVTADAENALNTLTPKDTITGLLTGRRRKRRDLSAAFTAEPVAQDQIEDAGQEKAESPGVLERLTTRLTREKISLRMLRPSEATLPEATPEYDLMDTRRYVGADKHMRIDKKDWRELTRKFAGEKQRGKLIQLLQRIVEENDIEPPTRMITRDEAIEEFRALQALDRTELLDASRTHSRFNYKATLGLLIIDANDTGNRTSDYLFQDIRWTCKGGRLPSPSESWNDPNARKAIFHHMIDADVPYVDRHRLRKHLGTRRYIPTAYRPATAKALFDLLKPEAVLDLSFGWGDRLVGFEASKHTRTYFGIDPDKRVLEQGRKLHKLCRQTRKSVELYNSPAEDFAYDILDPVDMLYFAPPPFNTERYTEEATQAHTRYEDEHAFVYNFLVETIRKAWPILKPGGTLAIDLGDLKAPKRDAQGRDTGGRYRLVDPMLRALKRDLDGAIFRGSVGACVGHGRPDNSFDAVRVDPIWIITKGHSAVLRQALFGRKQAAKIPDTAKAS